MKLPVEVDLLHTLTVFSTSASMKGVWRGKYQAGLWSFSSFVLQSTIEFHFPISPPN